MKLAWGRTKGLPEGLEAAWGARLIWPADLVHDRQALEGTDEQEIALLNWLNSGPLAAARERLLALARPGTKWDQRSEMEAILYSDERGKIIGSPQASSGYVYVSAWLFEHIAPAVHTFEDSSEAYDASQCLDEIRDGDVLKCGDGVVGVLVKAWPVALSEERGAFHRPGGSWPVLDGRDYTRSAALARQEIDR